MGTGSFPLLAVVNSGVKNVLVIFLVNICVCFPLGSGDPRLGVYLCSALSDPARVSPTVVRVLVVKEDISGKRKNRAGVRYVDVAVSSKEFGALPGCMPGDVC